MYDAKILADSVSPSGERITTMEVEWPHAVHKDFMTHCAFARNFKSFRARPAELTIEEVLNEPFRPDAFRSRVKGMGEGEMLPEQELAEALWQDHVDHTVSIARRMNDLKIAKAQVNFPLQDLCPIRGIVTATEWDNFFALRAFAPEGQKPRPEVEKAARMMYEVYRDSEPITVYPGHWHLPLVAEDEILAMIPSPMTEDHGIWKPDWNLWKGVSTGRCGRVSYLTHKGVRDPEVDTRLHDSLLSHGHMSPFEHPCRPFTEDERQARTSAKLAVRGQKGLGKAMADQICRELDFCGKFNGWVAYRKEIPFEYDYSMMEGYHVSNPA